MIPEVASLQAAKEKQDTAVLEKIRVLNNLLSTTIPIEIVDGNGHFRFRENTLYIPAFDLEERNRFKKKIMELVKTI